MTPDALRSALRALGMTQRDLAAMLSRHGGHRVHRSTVGRWARGEAKTPPGVAAWLRLRLALRAQGLPDPHASLDLSSSSSSED